MDEIISFLHQEEIREDLIEDLAAFRRKYVEKENLRVFRPDYIYYGKETWEKALAALLSGENLLLAGSKATGKNVLAENLAWAFGRPLYEISFHINADASSLIGCDTYDGNKVCFRPGPVYAAAQNGGFAVLDEINMARNEALAVLHAALDFRRVIEVSGYDRLNIHPATRFIATMNYGYAGTRELNEALCSRFAILTMPLIAEQDLARLLRTSFPDMSEKILPQFVSLFYEIEKKAGNAEISERAVDLRGLLDAIRLMKRGVQCADALEMCLVNKTFDRYERTLIKDVLDARIPSGLSRNDIFRV